jgi:L-lactate dehydrogenase complex protein LldG
MGTGQTAREEMLATIKRALQRDAAHDLPHPDLKPEAASHQQLKAVADTINQRNAAGRDALVNQFGSELARLGAQLTIAESTVAAGAAVEGLARARQAKAVVSWRAPLIDALGLKTRLEGANIRFVADDGASGGDGFVDHAMGAEVGITAVDYALADTGTLVLLTRVGQARTVSLLPPLHVALVKPEQIIAGLDDLFPLMRYADAAAGRELTGAVTFITGPSRTADIELTLVVGVHGPQELHVIVLKQG